MIKYLLRPVLGCYFLQQIHLTTLYSILCIARKHFLQRSLGFEFTNSMSCACSNFLGLQYKNNSIKILLFFMENASQIRNLETCVRDQYVFTINFFSILSGSTVTVFHAFVISHFSLHCYCVAGFQLFLHLGVESVAELPLSSRALTEREASPPGGKNCNMILILLPSYFLTICSIYCDICSYWVRVFRKKNSQSNF